MGQKSSKKENTGTVRRPRGLSTTESLAAIRTEEARLRELNANRAELATVMQPSVHALLARLEFDRMCKVAERRQRIAEEILSTETSYVDSLNIILDVFGGELAKEKLVDDAQLRMLFPDLRTLLNYNSDLRDQLTAKLKHWKWTTCLGAMFIASIPYLKAYTNYVNQYPAAQALLKRRCTEEEAFTKALDRASANPRCKHNDLDSFMIMPIQRVPRYVLLLDDLLRCTPEGHCDHDDLKDAVAKIREVATLINTSKKHADNAQKLIEVYGILTPPIDDLVQPHRSILCRGSLTDFSEAGKHPNGKMYLFCLFNDMLIKAGEKQDKHGKHTVKLVVDLAGCAVTSIPDNGRVRNAFSLTKATGAKQITLILSCKTADSTSKWLGLFHKSLADIAARQKSFATRPDVHIAEAAPLSRSSTSALLTRKGGAPVIVNMSDKRSSKSLVQSATTPVVGAPSAPAPSRANTIHDFKKQRK